MPEPQPLDAACPECEGRGWVIVEDSGSGTARPCDCRKRRLAARLLGAAGIPERYAACTLEGFRDNTHPSSTAREQLLQARRTAEVYVDTFYGEGRHRESGLLFSGPAGAGKTHLAVGVLRALIQRYGVRGRFTDFTTLIHQIQTTFDPSSAESKSQVLDPVVGAEVLVLDELGAQKPTPWVQDILYLIINTRYTERRPTLFTTNYPLERSRTGPREASSLDRGPDPPAFDRGVPPLEERIPAQLISRLFEMALPVVLDRVPDWRRDIKRKRALV